MTVMAATSMYAPNQQAVRADGSGPAEEGTGAGVAPEPPGRARKSKTAAARDDNDENGED